MGMMLNMLLLLSIWSIGLAMFGIPTAFANFITGQTNLQASILSVINVNNLAALLAIAGVIAAAAIFGAANAVLPYVLFAPIALSLVTFFVFPNDIFSGVGVPTEVQYIAQGLRLIVTLALMVSVVTWYKQGGD